MLFAEIGAYFSIFIILFEYNHFSQLTEGAKSLNSGSVTVHNILLAPKDDKVNPPEPTASSPTPTISKLPMSSHLDSSISDNVENVESGEAGGF